MSTSTGNLSAIPRYDPATANQVKTSNTGIGSTAQEIQNNFMKMLVTQMQNQILSTQWIMRNSHPNWLR